MKIDNISPLTQPGTVNQGKGGDKVSTEAPKQGGNATAGEVAHLRQPAADSGQDIDTARVDEIRQAISEGRLEIRADKIADGLIASVRDLLDADSQ
ncbi:MAG: flagellar biosynthesis anti-sigma factor FlgM [Alloalcanivorax venustensis]|uniref:Negative regulator of flagellin synthesis n=2 Tax=Alloalcanivorax venustensis TaxID=172371 RepID=A0ABS0AIZ4_9GAMM|nr:flagellar biosynthesis anti-sigma factor FlgM [Alloalcanivorax venustensis]MCH2553162.1 flagellar biosynthesis anti-sigma factor FlgM [Alcanivorax sp.]MEA3259037.1 flagellar biosynthesis anti-sigma factor FlgM [Pseudomonadota bacterium]SMO49208.1 anti-sigma-28 factor, FlgM family [Alcanivorax sp. DSM 26295]MBF5054015.1 Anti-sigma-28 factor [Alloalcanivorax venustensis ISO4]MEC8878697.1 flagellar biosynthesis anti-sigma factor FlgM [Pseudomonadota bacterium]